MLEIGYETTGDPRGPSAILSHGFPYDVRAWDDVITRLADVGAFVVAPYLRGFRPTRFRDAATPRSGQQAALGHDLIDLMDGLGIERVVVAGYDWRGRPACIAAALWPERGAGLVTVDGYTIQAIAHGGEPATAPRSPVRTTSATCLASGTPQEAPMAFARAVLDLLPRGA